MIQIESLKFRYPQSDFELDIENLAISSGHKVAVAGPSGCGKTTLLNLICGINIPDAGKVAVADQVVSEMSDKARRDFRVQKVGAVFQQFELVEYLNVRDNILLPYLINRQMKLDTQVRQHANDLANAVGIADKMKRSVLRLSQGEKQRVAICRALLTRPSLILADEPTGNLDPDNKLKILDLLFEQCQQNGLTLITVTHDTNILSGFDRTIDFRRFRNLRENDS